MISARRATPAAIAAVTFGGSASTAATKSRVAFAAEVLAAAVGTGVRLVDLAQVHALELELLHRLLDSLVRLHLEVVDVALDALVERLLGDATEHLDRHGERGRSKIARCPLLDSRDRRRAGALTDAEGATGRSERGGVRTDGEREGETREASTRARVGVRGEPFTSEAPPQTWTNWVCFELKRPSRLL